jgi:hypothetical protein
MKNKTIHLVYKVTNLETGEAYIGATTRSIEERKADHIQKANKGVGGYFQEAIGTYGPDSFSWEQIDTANNSNELAEKEKQYILQYNSKDKGYNADSGGGFMKTVYQYCQDCELIASFSSLKEVESTFNYDKRRIQCLHSNFWDIGLLLTVPLKSLQTAEKEKFFSITIMANWLPNSPLLRKPAAFQDSLNPVSQDAVEENAKVVVGSSGNTNNKRTV